MSNRTATATITFHASHNYGSVLQAYALQTVIRQLGYDNEIIDLRTERQIDLYTVFTKRKGLRYILKNASHLMYCRKLRQKYQRFEEFINNRLILTKKTFSSLEEIENADLDYADYIAGSDQIWNPVPADFDWSYFLPFVKKGKRIAYAPSFGQLASTGDSQTINRIKDCLTDFDSISVREKGAQDNVRTILGKTPEIVLDPTLLLTQKDWNTLLNTKYAVPGEYIFLYTLFANKEILSIAKRLSKKLGIPVITSNFSNQYDVFTPFHKAYDAGPLEFLSLVKNARLVVATSFHGTVFSVLFHTPFFSIHGDTDARISNLLSVTGLEARTLSADDLDEKVKNAFNVDFSAVDSCLEPWRIKSLNYLKQALSEE